MNILLTGASGFVGSHLVERFLKDGHFVCGVDNLITGREKNIKEFQSDQNFQFFKADVSEPLPNEVQKLKKWDWVMHFASPASPPKYLAAPLETMKVNGEGTRFLLELAQGSGAKFFYASTSEVYGDPLVHPQTEAYWGNVNPNGLRSVYDEAKRYGEAMTYLFHREHKVDVRVIRIFNTYGPKMDPTDGRVVTNLMFQALKGEPMTIYGDGKQTRSFQFVSDLVEGIVRLMKSNYTQPVNLGNTGEFSILEFSEKVKALVGGESKITFQDLPSDDPKQRKPDITVAKKELGWEPKVSLNEGLQATLSYFKEFEL